MKRYYIVGLSCAAMASQAYAAPTIIRGTPGAPYRTDVTGPHWMDSVTRDMNGFVLENFDITVARNAVRLDRKHSNIVVRNGTFTLKDPQTSPNLPVALEVIDAHDVLVENVTAQNFQMVVVPNKYTNGDCFSGEKQSYNVVFRNTHAKNCSDGAYDFKTKGILFDNVYAENAHYCLRIWGVATGTTVNCKNWGNAGVQINPNASLKLDRFVIDPAPDKASYVFEVRKGGSLYVKECSGRLPAASSQWIHYAEGGATDNASVYLGPSCTPDGKTAYVSEKYRLDNSSAGGVPAAASLDGGRRD